MENEYVTRSGILLRKINKSTFEVIRRSGDNNLYIAQCASLAFHKALIGLTELEELEEIEKNTQYKSLHMSRAVNTYYVVYHLFTMIMLLDNTYIPYINMKGRIDEVNHIVQLELELDSLNNPQEFAKVWDEQQDLEKDLASSINHSDIKEYCRLLRENKGASKSNITQKAYNYFCKELENENESIPALYNKLCYVRDRTVYRPTVVLKSDGCGTIQTSLDIRKEIENLPKAMELYKYIEDIYKTILGESREKNNDLLKNFMDYLWGTMVMEDETDLKSRYTHKEIMKLNELGKNKKAANKMPFQFGSYISQMVEIAHFERIQKYYYKYWEPLFKRIKDRIADETWKYDRKCNFNQEKND